MAIWRIDDAAHNVAEVINIDEALGNLDEVRLVAQDSSNERNTEPLFPGGGQFDPLFCEQAVTFDRQTDICQRRIGISECVHQEADSILFGPFLNGVEDDVSRKILAGNLENLIADLEQVVGSLLLIRAVLVKITLSGVDEDEMIQQLLRFFNAIPAEVMDHLTRDSHQQGGICTFQEIEDDHPFTLALLLAPLLFLENLSKFLM